MNNINGSKHKRSPSIYSQLRWSFGCMTFVIFMLFWAIIYIAENQLEILSLHHWLDTEATQYARNYEILGEDAPLPNEKEFDSYWSEDSIPSWLNPSLNAGFYEFQLDKESDNFIISGFYEYILGEDDKHFLVFEHPSGRGMMYLVFKDESDDYLDAYESSLHRSTFFLGILLIIIMISYGMYIVRLLSTPLATVIKQIERLPPDQPNIKVSTRFIETQYIEKTLRECKGEIADYFIREQEFSRFASHELRTPIMVIKGSVDILNYESDASFMAKKSIARIQSACNEMQTLTEAFLLLGKKNIELNYYENYDLKVCLDKQLSILNPLFSKQNVTYRVSVFDGGIVYSPEVFITIVINNLIKNAFSYSVGELNVEINDVQFSITNRHDGNDMYNSGYGCGLVIVKRICERMGWMLILDDDGERFTAKVKFLSRVN